MAELFCSFSVCNLRCISGAQFNPDLTDALRDAAACTRVSRKQQQTCQCFPVCLWNNPGHLPPAAGSLWQCYSLLNKDEAILQWVSACSGELSPVIESKYKAILRACKQLGQIQAWLWSTLEALLCAESGVVQGPEETASRLLKPGFNEVQCG